MDIFDDMSVSKLSAKVFFFFKVIIKTPLMIYMINSMFCLW